jgi:hypothetical protein
VVDPNLLLLAFSGLMTTAAAAMAMRRREAFRTVELLDETPAATAGTGVAQHVRLDTLTALRVTARDRGGLHRDPIWHCSRQA